MAIKLERKREKRNTQFRPQESEWQQEREHKGFPRGIFIVVSILNSLFIFYFCFYFFLSRTKNATLSSQSYTYKLQEYNNGIRSAYPLFSIQICRMCFQHTETHIHYEIIHTSRMKLYCQFLKCNFNRRTNKRKKIIGNKIKNARRLKQVHRMSEHLKRYMHKECMLEGNGYSMVYRADARNS